MHFLNTGFEALFSGIFAAFLAQLIKVIAYYITDKKINFKLFTTTGGMPSSHSAGTVGLATSVGIITGWSSIEFAIAIGTAIVVMQDAAGLRRAAGKTAATLNRLVKEMTEHTRSQISPYEVLKELLGHTPIEVFVGAIFGVFVAFCVHYTVVII